MPDKLHWELYYDNKDGFDHHCCSECRREAIFEFIKEPDYDEDYDGNMQYLGEIIVGIYEYLTPYCPYCGNKLIKEEDIQE